MGSREDFESLLLLLFIIFIMEVLKGLHVLIEMV